MTDDNVQRGDVAGPDQSIDRAEVDRLLGAAAEAFFERLSRGEHPSIEEYAERHPEIAELIRETFVAVNFIDPSVAGHSAEGRGSNGSAGVANQKSVGDFRIICEIGRGGMGVVYEAEQMSLGRSVALKVLPYAAMMDLKAITRFKNEARAAATLDHPHIVPVFAVGQERGIHYYAMALIDGLTVAELMRNLRNKLTAADHSTDPLTIDDILCHRDDPSDHDRVDGLAPTIANDPPTKTIAAQHTSGVEDTYREVEAAISTHRSRFDRKFFHSVARLGAEASEALDHAHQQGIVHRDIKPGNLMIDANAKLWVTDFGLARIESDAEMTMTGDLVGTLRYMAPEQALAKRGLVDHRADIYAMGASLYELLALRPVFDGGDREALLKQITFEEPKPLRHCNRAVPKDLQTIVHKALSKTPDERYATAQEMADDLHAFIQDEPIKARPLTITQRTGKWAAKRKGLVTSVAGVLILAVMGLLVSNAMIAQERNKARAAEQEAWNKGLEADRQRQLAEANAKTARETVDKYLTKVSTNQLLNARSMQPLRKELLELARDYYLKFIQQYPSDQAINYELAVVYHCIGVVYLSMGSTEDSIQANLKAISIYETLIARHPADNRLNLNLATTKRQLGSTYHQIGATDEASEQFGDSLAIAERMVKEYPDDLNARWSLALSYEKLASLTPAGRINEAVEFRRKAIESFDRLVQEYPDDTDFLIGLVVSYVNRPRLKDTRLAEEHAHRAVAAADKVIHLDPENTEYQYWQGCAYRCLGGAQNDLRKYDQAIESLDRAIELNEHLVQLNPMVRKYKQSLSDTYRDLANAFEGAGYLDESVAARKKTIAILEKLFDQNTEISSPRDQLVTSYNKLISLFARSGETEEEKIYRNKMLCLIENIAETKRTVRHWGFLGHQNFRLARYSEARYAYEKGIELRSETEPTIKNGPRWWYLAMSLAHEGETEKARTYYDRLVNEMSQSTEDVPSIHHRLRRELAELLGIDLAKSDSEETARNEVSGSVSPLGQVSDRTFQATVETKKGDAPH